MDNKIIKRTDLPKCPLCGNVGISYINKCYVRCSNEKCLLNEKDFNVTKWKECSNAAVQR